MKTEYRKLKETGSRYEDWRGMHVQNGGCCGSTELRIDVLRPS
jgi:hypothetical protein